MILRRQHLTSHPTVFRAMTGLTPTLFEYRFDLDPEDQPLLTIVWLRQYPTQEVLGSLFGVSDSTALRAIGRCLPPPERSGRDTMRMPDPGRGRRKGLPQSLAETPESAVLIDTFERRIQRPRRQQRAYYSGEEEAQTLKSQVAVDEQTGRVADVAESRPGRWADLKVLRRSELKRRLPKGVGALGDLAYVGIGHWHPEGLGATPRRKPRGRRRPEADRRSDRALARRRIVVEHAIGRLRRYQALSQVDRHHRRDHTARVRTVAGLINRMLDHRAAA